MWIKIAIVVALLALLGWSTFKLLGLRRKEKAFKRHFHEPILNPGDISSEDEFEDDIIILEKKLEPKVSLQEDNDEVLGLKAVETSVSQPEERASSQPSLKSKVPEVIIIHLMAPAAQPYIGYELLQSLLAAGLRFGAQNIFHRHEAKSGTGEVLFHLASVNAPGTFELSKMGGFSCPGLSFFMQLNDKIDNAAAFELMLDTAHELQAELGGELIDEHRKNLSMDKITDYRLRIRDYQESEANRLPDFFEQYS